jgi:deoxyribodipyrimidine photo-lyase
MVHLDDLPFPVSELPDMYTEFRKAVEKDSLIREINEKPSNIKTPEINF